MNYAAIICYDGSKYYGFQRLNNYTSVQKEIETALSIIDKDKVLIKGAGRTDRGVHGINQVINFSLKIAFPQDKLKKIINDLLPKSIRVIKCVYVDEKFHSRFSAIKKEYTYKIYQGIENPLLNDYYYYYPSKLDIRLMKKASKKLLGQHDFHNFVSGERIVTNSIIYKVKIKKAKDTIIIKFTGKSFYKYMVRNLVGSLIEIGSKKKNIGYIDDLLSEKIVHVPTIPPNGLYLTKVTYEKKYNLK